MAKVKLTFERENCKGCLLCVDVCPKDILELDRERVNAKGYNPLICVDLDACTACAMCAQICPDSVIKVEREVE
ncbi:MAG: 4Fe-4S binding protein [Oscillospiraceae bacterium]|nr:4Fe-4S binding protein [Oscillospiraceae bacterium]